MDYFVYCRDKPGTGAVRDERTEAHWAFMDGYADRMIARGPTLSDDGETATGSMHIVDLPDAEAVRVFAFDEPYNRAGVFAEVMVHRWRNLLGRTMWDFEGNAPDSRFLAIAWGGPDVVRDHGECLVFYGELVSDDGSTRLGDALGVELPSPGSVKELLGRRTDPYDRIEVHRWRFGGRPST